jgi:hypothetical protein
MFGLPKRSTARKSAITVSRKSPAMLRKPTLGGGCGSAPMVRALVREEVIPALVGTGERPVPVTLMGETSGAAASSISWAVRTRFFHSA